MCSINSIGETCTNGSFNVTTKEDGLSYISYHFFYLRNRKHFPCSYRVIETRVKVWVTRIAFGTGVLWFCPIYVDKTTYCVTIAEIFQSRWSIQWMNHSNSCDTITYSEGLKIYKIYPSWDGCMRRITLLFPRQTFGTKILTITCFRQAFR